MTKNPYTWAKEKVSGGENMENGREEEGIPIENIDPQTCKKLGGTPTKEGFCLMRKTGEEEDGTVKYKPLKWYEKSERGRPRSPRSSGE